MADVVAVAVAVVEIEVGLELVLVFVFVFERSSNLGQGHRWKDFPWQFLLVYLEQVRL